MIEKEINKIIRKRYKIMSLITNIRHKVSRLVKDVSKKFLSDMLINKQYIYIYIYYLKISM